MDAHVGLVAPPQLDLINIVEINYVQLLLLLVIILQLVVVMYFMLATGSFTLVQPL